MNSKCLKKKLTNNKVSLQICKFLTDNSSKIYKVKSNTNNLFNLGPLIVVS